MSDLGDVVGGGTPASKEPAYWGGNINWISPADLTGYNHKTITKGAKSLTELGLKNCSAKVMPAGSVHFSSRAPIGYVVISSLPMSTNQGFKSLVPRDGVLNEYVYYYLKGAKQLAEKRASGTTFLELSGKAFGQLPVPLPPFDDQKRIVKKIETLLSELDKGIESLKTAREQLKVYRQAVLKHAFEGKLTAQWRAENKDKLESPEQLLARIQQKEPVRDCLSGNTAWSSCSVQEVLASGPTNGRSVKDRPNGFPVLRLTALKSGKIDLAERKSGDWDRSQAEPYLVKEGDFLLSRGNGSKHLVGRGGLVPKNTDEVAFPDTIVRLRVDSTRMLSEFFSLLWDSRFIRDQIEQSARTTAGIYKINQGHIKSFRVPVPSLSEQKVIVNSLEEKLTLTDRQENEIGAALLKAELLRQSILSLAFSGRLTS